MMSFACVRESGFYDHDMDVEPYEIELGRLYIFKHNRYRNRLETSRKDMNKHFDFYKTFRCITPRSGYHRCGFTGVCANVHPDVNKSSMARVSERMKDNQYCIQCDRRRKKSKGYQSNGQKHILPTLLSQHAQQGKTAAE